MLVSGKGSFFIGTRLPATDKTGQAGKPTHKGN
jgi:hypothetical protein